ncbi:MAG TPA: asparagine synthase (glutamine-hydrolyzing) [Chlamydiales bacterium]|nr:asparagine synthase (glutamine-hydrolyzing) [Chlamydiales bacterium]
MCGFTGWVDTDPQTINVLEKMTQTLHARGPDSSGFFYHGKIGLGHRRLKIVDLEGSLQPMISEDGRYVLAYNGELYNFRELKEELKALGRIFQTSGDTEVVLQSLIVWGEDALQRFVGMFAFAFWDKSTETLLLARDQLGVKPLYVFRDDQRIVFGSEIKALLEHPTCSREINPNAIGLYLECQYIPSPETIYQKIKKVPAGHVLSYKNGFLDYRCYWTPSYQPKVQEENVEELLRASVRSMMIADVPIGAFVSGGIDSSLIAALMQQESNRPIEMFSIALNHGHGEQQHAKTVAEHLGAKFHPFVVGASDVMETFKQSFDEPFADQALLPTLILSQMTRNHVKVVLTGEGADEIFAGYSNYAKRLRDLSLANRLHRTPLRHFYPFMPAKLRKSRLMYAAARPLSRRYSGVPKIFCRETYPDILTRDFLAAQENSLEQIAERHFFECDSEEYLDKMLHIDTRLWLADDLLTKVDRATMAYSIEARVPYLDHRLVELACKLPIHLKMQGMNGKVILKKIAEKYLPAEIVHRPKWGFVMPLGDWLNRELKHLVCEALSSLEDRNIFNRKLLQQLRKHPKKSDAMRIYSLLALELWFQNHIDYRF